MNRQKRYGLGVVNATIVALLGLFSGTVASHAQKDKPRFVAPDGNNSGRCETIERACASIGYAAAQANKGDVVLLAKGSYDVSVDESLFYLISGIIPVKPGYDKTEQFKTQDIHKNVTWLNKVPVEYRAQLRSMGFLVNTDQKGMSAKAQQQFNATLAQYRYLQNAQTQVSCVGGMAGQFADNDTALTWR